MSLTLSLSLTVLLWLFGLFINTKTPFQFIAFGALVASSFLAAIILNKKPQELLSKQFWRWNISTNTVMAISILAAIILSIWYRQSIHLSILPTHFKYVVIISCLIGITEEIIFRGIIQGEVAQWNAKGAILIGALAHAGYKASIFILPSETIDFSLLKLFTVTFLVGLIFGLSRYKSSSLWPALAGHAIFDLLVYAEQANALWWVW